MPARACFVAAAVNAYRQHFASIGGPSRAPSSSNDACHITWRPCSYPTSFQLSDLPEAFLHEFLTIMGSCAEPPSTIRAFAQWLQPKPGGISATEGRVFMRDSLARQRAIPLIMDAKKVRGLGLPV